MSIPKSFQEAALYPKWKQAMNEEMNALLSHQIWELVPLSPELPVISCRWAFILKYMSDGIVKYLLIPME